MQTCFFCGNQVELRYSEYGLVPHHLHAAPCSFSRVRDLRASRSFCHLTRCPSCRKDVFFVRHNGGSVWLDELRYPWVKHGCMHDHERVAELHLAFDLSADINPSFSLGCVLDAKKNQEKSELIVDCEGRRVAHLVVSGNGNMNALKGQLVFFSERAGLCRYYMSVEDLFDKDGAAGTREIHQLAWLPL